MGRSICVVFDIDDTLYLERDYVHSGFDAVGRWAANCFQIGDFGERCWKLFTMGHRGSIFDDVLNEMGREPSRELISALVETYRTHTPSISLAPDASEALTEIGRAATIAIVSDGPLASQSRKVEALGLCSRAAPIVLTEALGSEFRKPHPKGFEQVQQRRPADLFVYVADNPRKDFTAPRDLGWITIRVRRPCGLHYGIGNLTAVPDFEMTDCSGLPEVLAHL